MPGQIPWQKYIGPIAVVLAVKGGNITIIYQDMLTALADGANDRSIPCHEQRTCAATDQLHTKNVLCRDYKVYWSKTVVASASRIKAKLQEELGKSLTRGRNNSRPRFESGGTPYLTAQKLYKERC